MKEKLKNGNQGITLIALIITIIVMLILVATAVSVTINSGLFEKAGEATREWKANEEAEQQLANGQVTINNKAYNNIDEYVEESNKITFYITCYESGTDGVYKNIEYTVNKGTTWEQFLSENQVAYQVNADGSYSYAKYDCPNPPYFGMPDEAAGSYVMSGGGPLRELGVDHLTGPWIFPSTLLKDGVTYEVGMQ